MIFKKLAFSAHIHDQVTESAGVIDAPTARRTFHFPEFSTKIKVLVLKLKTVPGAFKSLILKFSLGLRNMMSFAKHRSSDFSDAGSPRRIQNPFSGDSKKFKKTILLLITLLVLVSAFLFIRNKIKFGGGGSVAGDKIEVGGPQKSISINRDFYFPLKDAKGEELSKIKYTIEKAELRDEIIVKGQKATAVKGRTFLIVYLKVTNEYSSNVDINTRDYVRLSINGNETEWLAPDIHNDPVEVQAQSTKTTRIGFPLNESDKQLFLRVGEINGDKEKVEL